MSPEIHLAAIAIGCFELDVCFGVGALILLVRMGLSGNMTSQNMRLIAAMYLVSSRCALINGALSSALNVMAPMTYGLIITTCVLRVGFASQLLSQANFIDRWRR